MVRASKMSVQGVQPKLSAILNIKKGMFDIVDKNGRYILKPQHHIFPELPQNENLTMHLAATIGIRVPLNGLVYSKDNSFTYFIKRFDRRGQKDKVAVEDFAQLAGKDRDTKYTYSMEKLVRLVDDYCTFPSIEKVRLFNLVLFNYLVGNEDMHLKNYSRYFQGWQSGTLPGLRSPKHHHCFERRSGRNRIAPERGKEQPDSEYSGKLLRKRKVRFDRQNHREEPRHHSGCHSRMAYHDRNQFPLGNDER